MKIYPKWSKRTSLAKTSPVTNSEHFFLFPLFSFVTKKGLYHRSNAKNDALLHRLVHTRLLSGSLNEELDLSRGKRQRALQGRLLELSSGAKLGKGDTIVTREERSKANKRVRLGLERKTRERQAKALDEVSCLLLTVLTYVVLTSEIGKAIG